MGPCMIHYIDNSWKVAPISTSTAPIASYHCTFMDVNVKCCVDFHSTTHMSSLTDPMTLHSSPIHVWVLDRKALENNPHIGRFGRLKFQVISKPGWLTNWMYWYHFSIRPSSSCLQATYRVGTKSQGFLSQNDGKMPWFALTLVRPGFQRSES